MENNVFDKASYQLEKNKTKRRWKKVVSVLASIVVFCTTYALILPAITMEGTAYCGTEEHQHSDACYKTELVCELINESVKGHSHTTACYIQDKTLTCTMSEEGHVHEDNCKEKLQNLICELKETEEHVHGEECYEIQVTDVCGFEEQEPHVHEEACWEVTENLKCGLEEIVPAEGHRHTEACYKREINCSLEVHEHALACYSNPKADVETANVWEKTIPDEMTGIWADDVLAIAESQLGYKESESNYIVADDGELKGYTRYGDWYGDSYGHWCAMFVSFCLDYAEVTDFPLEANCQNWIEKLSEPEVNLFREPDEYEFQPGDLIFFDYEQDGTSNHIGLVTEYIEATEGEAAQIKTIEGNSSDKVRYRTYAVDDESIIGFGDLGKAYEKAHADVIFQKVYSDENVTVTASYSGFAEIPEDAELIVKKIEQESNPEAYEEYLNQAVEMMAGEVADIQENNQNEQLEQNKEKEQSGQPNIFDFRLYDISFWKDGQEIEPKDRVTVEISYLTENEVPEDAQISVIHYGDEGTERPAMQQTNIDEDGNVNASFETDSFSVYAVVAAEPRAVDGQYTVLFDGQMAAGKYYTGEIRHAEADRVTASNDAEGYVTMPTDFDTGKYNYTIKGWYDILTGAYYPHTPGGKIPVTQNTVFYPDYVIANYDIGKPENVVTNQPDTSDFITTRLFDYNELFNTHSVRYDGNSFTRYNLENSYNWVLDNNLEGALGFVFTDYVGKSANYSTNDVDSRRGNIARVAGIGQSSNASAINVDHTDGDRGSDSKFTGTVTPNILNDERKNALFTPNDNYLGRDYVGEADWFYSYDEETGFYYYNSALNAVAYNKTNQRFYVYNEQEKIEAYGANSMNDFLPFNYGKDTYSSTGSEINYWFGMTSAIEFYLPANSGNAANKASNGEDMQFRFSGDDDVWVFVDDQLVLDLGGVHDIVYGEINFATGKYKIAHKSATNTATAAGNSIKMPGTTDTNANRVTTGNIPALEGGRDHTLTVYYLERGSTLSNCAIYFNIAPVYELEIVKRDEDGETLLEGAEFKIYDDPECTNPAELVLVDENGNFSDPNEEGFVTGTNGTVLCNGLYPGRTYYIKETKAPEFYPDISKYIIELNLSKTGEPTIILKSTNGDEWVYAKAYRYSESGHRVILDVYNSHFLGGEKEVYVEKVWLDENGKTGSPSVDEITVHLYGKINGELIDTERVLKLHAGNEWKGSFLNLPKTDQNGVEYEYVVKEDVPSGYKVTYEELEPKNETTTVEAGWMEVSPPKFEVDEKYLFAIGNQVLTSVGGSSQNFTMVNLDVAKEINPDNGNQNNYWWEVEKNGNSFYIKNGNGKYMRKATNVFLDSGQSYYGVGFTITENGKLYLSDGTYFQKIRTDNGKVQTTQDVNEAAVFTLYKWVPESTTTIVQQGGWQIINELRTEADKISIPVEKQWDTKVPDSDKGAVEFNLYLVEGADKKAQFVKSVTVTADNGWKGSFDEIILPDDGMYYCIMERTDSFSPVYSNPITVVIEGHECTMGLVEFKENTAEVVEFFVKNYALYELPETGGGGSFLYTMGGLLMMTAAGFTLLYKIIFKRRKGDRLLL